MTLQEAKDQIARNHGYDAWGLKIYENGDEMMEKLCGEVAHLVHSEACRKQREICADKARIINDYGDYIIDKDSIKNAPEPPLL